MTPDPEPPAPVRADTQQKEVIHDVRQLQRPYHELYPKTIRQEGAFA